MNRYDSDCRKISVIPKSDMQLQPADSTANEVQQVRLEKVRVEWASTKTQMVLGVLLILLTCLVGYARCLSIGFLLDDFAYIHTVAEAAAGRFSGLLQTLIGGAPVPGYLSEPYRPIVSISLLLDYLVWHTNAFGYHLTNLALLFGGCVFVSLISLEITGSRGNRLGAAPAIWSGLLFAVCPTHAPGISWVMARPDLLCGFFFLASWWAYLRFRLLREKGYLVTSLLCFSLSFFSHEAAIMLPLVIAWSELLLGSDGYAATRATKANRLIWVAWFFLLAGAIATLRFALAGPHAALSFTRNIELIMDSGMITHKTLTIAGLVCLLLFARALTRSIPWQPFLFLIPLPLLLVPPAAPLCLLLSLSALPAVDVAARKRVLIRAVIGTTLLFVHFIMWGSTLEERITDWVRAGKEMSAVRGQLHSLASVNLAQTALLYGLPQKYEQAGVVGRSENVPFMLQPPFETADFSGKFQAQLPVAQGSPDFVWPSALEKALANGSIAYVWNGATFKRFTGGSGPQHFETSLSVPRKVTPGTAGAVIDFPGSVDTTAVQLAIADLTLTAPDGCSSCLGGKSELLWDGRNGSGRATLRGSENERKAWLGRYKDWTLAGEARNLRLFFAPGDYTAEVRGLRIVSSHNLVPTIEVERNGSSAGFRYDASNVEGAAVVKIIITKPGTTFDATSEREIATSVPNAMHNAPLLTIDCSGLKGFAEFPPQLLASSGAHQARAIATDKYGLPVGLPGEPVSIIIP
jgi:hypothetical protein